MVATANAHNLSAYLVSELGSTETLKLQKLLYYCNAWSLALRSTPVFEDPIEAWKHGPVVANIYHYHKRSASVDTWKHGDPSALSPEDKAIADAILKLYGARSGWSLRNLTHDEKPWIDAWDRCESGLILGEVITHEAMAEFYGQKIHRSSN